LPYENLKVLILSSRDRLCINEDIDKGEYQGKLLSQRCNELTNITKTAKLHNYYQRANENDARTEIPEELLEAK
jgi:DEAD_2